jgi:6-phosphogluconolactonase
VNDGGWAQTGSCRTFHIDPSGRMLVAAHNVPMLVRDGAGVKTVPVDTRDQIMFWMGMVPL